MALNLSYHGKLRGTWPRMEVAKVSEKKTCGGAEQVPPPSSTLPPHPHHHTFVFLRKPVTGSPRGLT